MPPSVLQLRKYQIYHFKVGISWYSGKVGESHSGSKMGESHSGSKVVVENQIAKGKCENRGSWRIPQLQECLLVIWLDAITVVTYLYTVQHGQHINASCCGCNLEGL